MCIRDRYRELQSRRWHAEDLQPLCAKLGEGQTGKTLVAVSYTHLDVYKRQVLTGAKYISFAEGVENGMIRFVGDDCKKALYDAIEARQVRPGLCP